MTSPTTPNALRDFVQQQKTKSTSSLSSLLTNGLKNAEKSTKSFFPLLIKTSSSTTASKSEASIDGDATKDDSWLPSSFKEEKGIFSLTRTQRIIGFAFCIICGIICFTLASFYIPVLVFKARKFGALYSLGSCFTLFSFALLRGPSEYMKHSFNQTRMPMTLSYLISLMATLYCSLWIKSTLLTIVCVSVQVITLLWFLLSYVPGGETGLKFISSAVTRLVCRKGGSTLLPV